MDPTTQMWLGLLLAVGVGGAIGWALHIYYLKRQTAAGAAVPAAGEATDAGPAAHIADLEDQLKRAMAETDELRAKSGIPKPGQEGVGPPEGSLTWRNRHLESRVRFLEGKLADLETDGTGARPTEDQNDEATRLRWRNRYLEGRVKYLEEELVRTGGLSPVSAAPAAQSPSAAAAPKGPEGEKPELVEAARDGQADDLKQISGIGPKLEQKLNSIGIWHYDQVASWNQANVDWVNAAISFRGRIEREGWVSQARQLTQDANADREPAPEENA